MTKYLKKSTTFRISNKLVGLVVMIMILLVGISPQWGFQLSRTEATQEQTQTKNINGLFAPRIDGYMDSNNVTGYLNEWGDAKLTAQTLISNNSNLNVDIYSKYVSDIFYVGFRFPKALDMVSLQVDRDNDNKLSNGDVRLSFEKTGKLIVHIYENGEIIMGSC